MVKTDHHPLAQRIGRILLLLGLVITLVSALADVIGLGASPEAFGYRQLIGTAVGLLLLVIGVTLLLFSRPPPPEA